MAKQTKINQQGDPTWLSPHWTVLSSEGPSQKCDFPYQEKNNITVKFYMGMSEDGDISHK